MKRRPWPLIVLAVIHLMAPIGNILVNSLLMDVSPWIYFQALLLPENWYHAFVFFGIPIFSAALIYACKKWSYYAYIAVMAVPFIYSFMSWFEAPSAATGSALIVFYLINIAIVGYFMIPSVRVVYFDPKLRWWETKPRYSTDFQAKIFAGDRTIVGQVKNISEGGLFVEVSADVPMNESFRIQFHMGQQDYIFNCKAVYNRRATPTGFGFKMDLDAAAIDQILNLIARLKDEGSVVSGRVPGPEESFGYWLKSLSRRKDGWIPQARPAPAHKTGSE